MNTRLEGSRASSLLRRRISSAIFGPLEQRAQPHDAVEHLSHTHHRRAITRLHEIALPGEDRLVHPCTARRSRPHRQQYFGIARLELRRAAKRFQRLALAL